MIINNSMILFDRQGKKKRFYSFSLSFSLLLLYSRVISCKFISRLWYRARIDAISNYRAQAKQNAYFKRERERLRPRYWVEDRVINIVTLPLSIVGGGCAEREPRALHGGISQPVITTYRAALFLIVCIYTIYTFLIFRSCIIYILPYM